ncbi:AMP-binding protein [Caulobacter mirabilis]|uniref:3-methylmercaptopropionyl-CoA ligase n=1 Tax=Caulobacter mirabilis TaxID=69666 RepID=A0A2D2AWP0_9CAUL|nr:AMP-binding protein [Caulobacter mirabilis]ATQ42413.1 AMP-binding protein [Caulobacter mirabilis]
MTQAVSLVRGAEAPPLLEHTIGEALAMAARRWPDAEALVSAHQGVRWTWSELLARADAFAAGLLALGLEPGDRVGVWGPNSAEWALAQFATARAGLIQVNINPAYRLSELEYTLNKVGVRALICAEAFKTSDYVGMVEALAPEIAVARPGALKAERIPTLTTVIKMGAAPRSGWLAFADAPARASGEDQARLTEIGARLDRNDPINIQFTSGTTGLPKGATLSHRNILNNAQFVGAAMGLRAGDRLCIPVPLYHCFGMVMGNLACTVHGATMVYPSEGFDPLAVLSTVEKERCTGLHGVPTMFIAELEHPEFERFDLSSLRTGIMAGSPCPIEVMRKVIDRMNMREVGIAYGMTETSPVSFQTSVDDPVERRVSTVGRVQPHLEVKVVDAFGNPVPRGEPGELCTRGYSVMLGYWDDPEKTAEAVDAEGWMHTGDLAVIDDEGYGNIVGRIKDMVIRGGENVYPREIEEFLFRHPKVEDVQVVGVPDPKFGEELCAWVKLRAGETATQAEIVDFCRGQIAHYKVPRYVRFVEAFPMTVTGKIQKFEIRAAMIAELGLAEQKTA